MADGRTVIDVSRWGKWEQSEEEEVPWSGLAEVGPQGAVIPDLV